MRRIPLSATKPRGRTPKAHTLVDDELFDWLSQWNWSLHTQGYAHRSEGVVLAGERRQQDVRLHRLIMGLVPGDSREVDHRDQNKLNNQRYNLRVLSRPNHAQNRTALDRRNISGYRGVTWDKKKCRWQARVRLDRRDHFLGYYIDPAEAGAVAARFRAEHMPYSEEGKL